MEDMCWIKESQKFYKDTGGGGYFSIISEFQFWVTNVFHHLPIVIPDYM